MIRLRDRLWSSPKLVAQPHPNLAEFVAAISVRAPTPAVVGRRIFDQRQVLGLEQFLLDIRVLLEFVAADIFHDPHFSFFPVGRCPVAVGFGNFEGLVSGTSRKYFFDQLGSGVEEVSGLIGVLGSRPNASSPLNLEAGKVRKNVKFPFVKPDWVAGGREIWVAVLFKFVGHFLTVVNDCSTVQVGGVL